MKLYYRVAPVIILLLTINCFGKAWEKVRVIKNIANPESVVFDRSTNTLYVSNQNYQGKEGSASIGKFTLEGKVIEKEWIKGLNKPKGIAISGNKLFVSDFKELVEIDIKKGKVIKRYSSKDIEFLNDVTISESGDVYVAEMFNSAIYRLDRSGNFELWLKSEKLENPNGLLALGKEMYISAWGHFANKQPKTAKLGNFFKISLKSKKLTKLTNEAVGNLDGVQRMEDGRFIVSDWINGDIFISDREFNFKRILDLEPSSGDIAYIAEKGLLLIPMAKQGTIQVYAKP